MKIDSKSQYVDYISIVADAVPNLDLRTNKITGKRAQFPDAFGESLTKRFDTVWARR